LSSNEKKDAAFPDGQTPPAEIRDEWFTLLKEQFRQTPNTCVAIHCVAGLGRAPVMVALALMELGMSYEEAVELIRSKRRGALNTKQLEFLEKYRPKNRLKSRNNPCSVM
jgi:protein tyrosine phosphatase type 4A